MLTIILFMSFLGLGFQESHEHAVKQPFTIVISQEKDTVAPGADVWIKVTLTNNSAQELDDSGNVSRTTWLDPNLQFDVRDQKGVVVPRRHYEHPELDTGNLVNRTLQRGESVTQEQRVSALYDMTQAGKYTIQVSMPVPGTSEKNIVKSNIITVTLSK